MSSAARVPMPVGEHLIVTVAAGLADRDALFDVLCKAFEFPGHFGRNWDALFDVFSDFSWHPRAQRLAHVTVRHADTLPGLTAEQRETYRTLLADVINDRSSNSEPPSFAFQFPTRG